MVKLSSNLTANQLIMTDWGVKHFNSARLGALREASKKGYDISSYAKPEYSAQKIRTLIAMQQGGCRVECFTQFNDNDSFMEESNCHCDDIASSKRCRHSATPSV